ncbi:MAG: CDGSH iron-sulfur domain-containing protein [bacterium]|nr:CDGSH iron-sulfur domain-containing protein [bacterium]
MSSQNKPYVLDVNAGDTLYLCQCGQSKNAPHCDGSHQGSGKTPHVAEYAEAQKVFVCGCGKSGNNPFCDGAHKSK